MQPVQIICEKAKNASRQVALTTTAGKNAALSALQDWLLSHEDEIIRANAVDVGEARQQGLSEAMIDRLELTEKRIRAMAADLENVISLQDPVGEVFEVRTLENGLRIHKHRVPLGVIGVVYESRPNVTIDVAALALKSGNCVVLRGGKETIHSNRVLVAGIQQALETAGLDADAVQFIDSPDRALVKQFLKMDAYVDMLIPRGGAGLHQFCKDNATIPVITGGIGICHLFIDESADIERSLEVIRNAKIQRPSTCNALDTILVHAKIAEKFIPRVVRDLTGLGVSIRIEAEHAARLGLTLCEKIQPVGEGDFDREWLSLTLSVRVVQDLADAVGHIRAHSSGHSDGILTENEKNAERFIAEVDSAAVYVNASTRFTDGAQLGLGAEVAISTQRLHARGPMALEELTTYKWVVEGDYHVRA